MTRKFTVYYEKATPPKRGKAAVIHEPRFVDKYGNDVGVPNHTMNMGDAFCAVEFLLNDRFNKERGEGWAGGDVIIIREVFD